MQSLKVKVVSETTKNVVIKMLAINRSFPVKKSLFEKRVKSGLYEVVV